MQSGDLSGFEEKIMKLTRLVLVCTVLLLAAVPSFALPPCQSCLDDAGPCYQDGGGGRCRTIGGVCNIVAGACIGFVDTTVLSEWTVASIEISHPAQNAKVVTTPSVVAQAELRQPAQQK
jgi:hypothetical protein